jgi:hypothetical protein
MPAKDISLGSQGVVALSEPERGSAESGTSPGILAIGFSGFYGETAGQCDGIRQHTGIGFRLVSAIEVQHIAGRQRGN